MRQEGAHQDAGKKIDGDWKCGFVPMDGKEETGTKRRRRRSRQAEAPRLPSLPVLFQGREGKGRTTGPGRARRDDRKGARGLWPLWREVFYSFLFLDKSLVSTWDKWLSLLLWEVEKASVFRGTPAWGGTHPIWWGSGGGWAHVLFCFFLVGAFALLVLSSRAKFFLFLVFFLVFFFRFVSLFCFSLLGMGFLDHFPGMLNTQDTMFFVVGSTSKGRDNQPHGHDDVARLT